MCVADVPARKTYMIALVSGKVDAGPGRQGYDLA